MSNADPRWGPTWGECPSVGRKGRARVKCGAGRHHDGPHIGLHKGEPVFWGRGL